MGGPTCCESDDAPPVLPVETLRPRGTGEPGREEESVSSAEAEATATKVAEVVATPSRLAVPMGEDSDEPPPPPPPPPPPDTEEPSLMLVGGSGGATPCPHRGEGGCCGALGSSASERSDSK